MTLPASTKTIMGKKLPSQGIGGVSPEFVSEFSIGDYRVGGKVSSFDNALNFARTGTATYTDSTGTLQTAATGVPRTDHHIWNGSAWVNQGLLLESDAATNLLTYSEQFDNAAWTKVGVTPVDQGGGVWQLSGGSTLQSYTQTGTVTVVVEAKSDSGTTFDLYLGSTTASRARLTFSTGVVSVVGADLTDTTATPLADGWFRFKITGVASSTKQAQFNPTAGAVLLRFPQLEANSIPTSYIKTEATTATRNAETLTASAADLPIPVQTEVTGTELVTNGTFATNDLTGWTDVNSHWSAATGAAVHPASTAFNQLLSDISSVTGKSIQLTFTVSGYSGSAGLRVSARKADQSPTGFVSDNFYADGSGVQPAITSDGTYTHTFTLSGNAALLSFARDDAIGSATAFTIDNISVKEVTPKSYSIQMEGTMSYADEDTSDNVTFLNWESDLDNRILIRLPTTAASGEVLFYQEATNIADFLISDNSTYTPGINVPFNIASRHGSTFINGAVDGTALTANTTPTALPDLTATDLEIAPNFNGTIKLLRIWGSDIGDTGIAAASD